MSDHIQQCRYAFPAPEVSPNMLTHPGTTRRLGFWTQPYEPYVVNMSHMTWVCAERVIALITMGSVG
jgi:hypothetical protein